MYPVYAVSHGSQCCTKNFNWFWLNHHTHILKSTTKEESLKRDTSHNKKWYILNSYTASAWALCTSKTDIRV